MLVGKYRGVVAAAATMALFVTGCGSASKSTAVAGPAGQYALQRAAEQPLPATIFDDRVGDAEDAFHLRCVVSTAQLQLENGGRYEYRAEYTVYIDGVPNGLTRWSDHGLYTVSNERVHFESNYIQNRRYDGVWSDRSVRITSDMLGEGKPVAFDFNR
jgi:hypothetical protein